MKNRKFLWYNSEGAFALAKTDQQADEGGIMADAVYPSGIKSGYCAASAVTDISITRKTEDGHSLTRQGQASPFFGRSVRGGEGLYVI